MKYKIKFAILSLIVISIFAIIYLQSNSKRDLKNVAIESKSTEISDDSRTNICDVILIPSIELKDLGVVSNGIIQLFNDSTGIVIPRGFRTNAKPWLNDIRLIDDNLYYMLQIYESFDLNLKNNITKNIIYTYSSQIKAYSLAIINSLERQLSDGEAKLPNEITEKDFPFMLSKYSKIYYLVQKDYMLSKLDSILIKQAKKKKIPIVFDEY